MSGGPSKPPSHTKPIISTNITSSLDFMERTYIDILIYKFNNLLSSRNKGKLDYIAKRLINSKEPPLPCNNETLEAFSTNRVNQICYIVSTYYEALQKLKSKINTKGPLNLTVLAAKAIQHPSNIKVGSKSGDSTLEALNIIKMNDKSLAKFVIEGDADLVEVGLNALPIHIQFIYDWGITTAIENFHYEVVEVFLNKQMFKNIDFSEWLDYLTDNLRREPNWKERTDRIVRTMKLLLSRTGVIPTKENLYTAVNRESVDAAKLILEYGKGYIDLKTKDEYGTPFEALLFIESIRLANQDMINMLLSKGLDPSEIPENVKKGASMYKLKLTLPKPGTWKK